MDFIIINVAKYGMLVSIALVGVFIWRWLSRKQWWEFGWFAVIALGLSLVFIKLANRVWFDPRPFVVGHFRPLIEHAADNGFPSDHTALTMALAAIVFPYNRKFGWLLVGISVAVGLARVLAGVHHVADIVGSIVLVVAAAGVSWQVVHRLILPKFHSKTDVTMERRRSR